MVIIYEEQSEDWKWKFQQLIKAYELTKIWNKNHEKIDPKINWTVLLDKAKHSDIREIEKYLKSSNLK